MADTIKLKFIASDFDGEYSDHNDCACVRAAKRQCQANNVVATGYDIEFDGQLFDFGPVYLDQNMIEADGFGYLAFELIRRKLTNDSTVEAYVELIPKN